MPTTRTGSGGHDGDRTAGRPACAHLIALGGGLLGGTCWLCSGGSADIPSKRAGMRRTGPPLQGPRGGGLGWGSRGGVGLLAAIQHPRDSVFGSFDYLRSCVCLSRLDVVVGCWIRVSASAFEVRKRQLCRCLIVDFDTKTNDPSLLEDVLAQCLLHMFRPKLCQFFVHIGDNGANTILN